MSTSRTVSVSLIWLSSLSGPLLLSREINLEIISLHLALHHELGKNACRLLLCSADS